MRKRTVLIVDDQEINRAFLGKVLEAEYSLLYAENGHVALKCLREHANIISAIFLDIIMPDMDGYEFLREMKADRRIANIPVIVSSQLIEETDEVQALALGAQDFIAKPYKPVIIRQRLSNIIQLREQSAIVNSMQCDYLTGLYNKEFFCRQVEMVLGENPSIKYDLVFIGIERFKLINDAYGIKKGDEVLKYVADAISEFSVGRKICARFYADNFFAFGEHATYTNDFLKPFIDKIKECPVKMGIKVHCGVLENIDTSTEIARLCDLAKMAGDMNRGKYNDYFTLYSEELKTRMKNEQFILSSMHSALEQGQFQVYYQPKYDLHANAVAGAEALVRWINPEKGVMPAGEFIPIFEKNGFITELDKYVWECTCKSLRRWMDEGQPALSISINMSRADIYNPSILPFLLEITNKYRIPIQCLHLEITESAYTENPEQIIEAVHKFREAGFIVEMDDFGTGYSSLNMLSGMPIDILKLDMRFIQKEAEKASGRGIISFIISLAKWMGLVVIAEGVETEDQIEILRSMDCNYVQGYYYAKPMATEEFEHFLKESRTIEIPVGKQITNQNNICKHQRISRPENGKVMLIVDDVTINRMTLATFFEEDYLIVEKDDGLDAWEYLDKHYEKVEVVMLDLLMPVMDGFELLQKIRQDRRMKDLPVIITSQGDLGAEQKTLEMQANDYIVKPYDQYKVYQRVYNVVGNYRYQSMIAKDK